MRISHFLVIASIALFCNGCINNKKTDTKGQDFTLSVEFIPALFRTGLCVIQKDGLNNTMSLDFIYKRKDRIPEDTINVKIINTAYLTTFPRDFTGDTLLVDSVETITLENEKIENFIKNLHSDLITQNDLNIDWMGLDGYAIHFNYKTDSIDRSFTYRPLRSADTTQYRLLRKIVSFMDENLKTKISKIYTKTWKEILKE
jgi:hypothetical protein